MCWTISFDNSEIYDKIWSNDHNMKKHKKIGREMEKEYIEYCVYNIM